MSTQEQMTTMAQAIALALKEAGLSKTGGVKKTESKETGRRRMEQKSYKRVEKWDGADEKVEGMGGRCDDVDECGQWISK